jgi:hypothetical protein
MTIVNSQFFTSRLAPLASEVVQERYGRRADKDAYILLVELLENAQECVTKIRADHPIAGFLSPAARDAIQALGPLLARLPSRIENARWADLLEGAAWRQLRQGAVRAIAALGFDLAAWERTEFADS